MIDRYQDYHTQAKLIRVSCVPSKGVIGSNSSGDHSVSESE
jgi:hypothetical protein